ncbi:MAG: hypothetical protein QMC73_12175, partial [Myxococcota bacterium]
MSPVSLVFEHRIVNALRHSVVRVRLGGNLFSDVGLHVFGPRSKFPRFGTNEGFSAVKKLSLMVARVARMAGLFRADWRFSHLGSTKESVTRRT